jgi:hypothetical protein
MYDGYDRFWDNASGSRFPFSIQSVAAAGLEFAKLPGQWLSLSTVAAILHTLNIQHKPFQNLSTFVFIDGVLYEDQVTALWHAEPVGERKGAVVFASGSLGLKSPDAVYREQLKGLFKMPQLIGVMGGRQKEALFFVGYQQTDFLFLDPHLVQVRGQTLLVEHGVQGQISNRTCILPLPHS